MRLPFLCPLVIALALAGCVPTTRYRYTAFTPTPQPEPWDGRGSGAGTLHLEGQLTDAPAAVALPVEHASALYVPRFTAGGSALLEVARGVQIGVAGSYASYSWADITTVGTMPVPDRPSLFGIGPDIRLSLALDPSESVVIGFAGRVLHYDIPYAEWTRDPRCPAPAVCATTSSSSGPLTYRLTNHGTEDFFVGEASIVPSFALGSHAKYGNVFGLAGITQTFHNDGFTDVRSGDGKVGTSVAGLLGGGYGMRASHLHLSVGFYYPVTGENELAYGGAGWFTVGVDPRLWEPAARAR